jgi:hydrogenase maturation protein HypF
MRYGLTGWVLNSSSGVDIEAQAPADVLEAFQAAISAEAPPLARIDRVTARPLPVDGTDAGFTIHHSAADSGTSLISPDVATCPDCLRELLDPADRRYRYPFTNCTNLRPALHDHPDNALRPPDDHDVRVSDVSGLPGRIREPA